MVEAWQQAWRTVVPKKNDPFGPMPPMLVGLTVLTGLVDAVSYLTLGHVFVANMTGNVVILGFAIAGAPGFSIPASLTALAFFAVGSALGGALSVRLGGRRDRLLVVAGCTKLGLIAVAAIVAAAVGAGVDTTGVPRYALIALLATSMGVQNAVVRKLAVPDLTTTVLTLTTTGIFADAKLVGGPGSKVGRRGISVLAMFLGALVGASLVLKVSTWAALVPAVVIVLIVVVAAQVTGRREPAWTRPPQH